MRDKVVWNGWEWNPQIHQNTPSGKLLNRLTEEMSKQPDFTECGLLIFGSSPIEFGWGVAMNSGDIDLTPNQFYPIFGEILREKKMLSGFPHIQLCPPGVFRPGQLWSTRAVTRWLHGIELTLPHPIDIIAGKLQRLDEGDYEGIEIIVHFAGRPTPQDLVDYAQQNPDWLLKDRVPNDKVINNLETLHAFLGGQELDIRNGILLQALTAYNAAIDQQGLSRERLLRAQEKINLDSPESSH